MRVWVFDFVFCAGIELERRGSVVVVVVIVGSTFVVEEREVVSVYVCDCVGILRKEIE